jgi:hypothetical protein
MPPTQEVEAEDRELQPGWAKLMRPYLKNKNKAGCQWLTPKILATQKAELRRILVQSQPRQKKG